MEGGLVMATWNVIHYTDIRPDRCDAEYHSKLYSDNSATLKKTGPVVTIGELFHTIHRGEQPNYEKNGTIKVLRSVNVGSMSFNDARQEYVTKEFFNKTVKGQVRTDDVLITSTGVGTLGRTSIWYDSDNAFCDGHITILRDTTVNPFFIAVFLNSKYGLLQFDQNYRGSSGQIEIYPFDIEKFIVPSFLLEFQNEIGLILKKAFDLDVSSKSLYFQAEELLAKELQLDQLYLPTKKWYSALYSEVIEDDRMNAEYFSPAVKSILSQGFLQGGYIIGDLFHVVRGYTPKSYYKSGVPVIKTKSVRVPNVDKKRITDYADVNEPLALTREHDLILAAMGVGSLGRTSYVTANDSDCAIDGTLRVLRRKNESLSNIEIPTMMFLATTVGQKLIYRGISGSTGIISLPDDYLAKIPIPVFRETVRQKVTELVLNSIKAKNHSEQLLAQAKRRVEELIEQEANKSK